MIFCYLLFYFSFTYWLKWSNALSCCFPAQQQTPCRTFPHLRSWVQNYITLINLAFTHAPLVKSAVTVVGSTGWSGSWEAAVVVFDSDFEHKSLLPNCMSTSNFFLTFSFLGWSLHSWVQNTLSSQAQLKIGEIFYLIRVDKERAQEKNQLKWCKQLIQISSHSSRESAK